MTNPLSILRLRSSTRLISSSSSSFSSTSSLVTRAAATSQYRQVQRPFSSTTHRMARKDAQSKDTLKPEPNEYSKSGSDDAAAKVEETAFSPDKTSPESQLDSAEADDGGSSSGNPLDVSPANQEVSKPRGAQEGGHDGSSAQSGQGPSDRARTSGGGGAKNSGKSG